MSARDLLNRWRESLAARTAARVEVILYVDGPRTTWHRAQQSAHFEEHRGGLRIALPRHFLRTQLSESGDSVVGICGCGWRRSVTIETTAAAPVRVIRELFDDHAPGAADEPSLMPEPHEGDILQRRQFRSQFAARIWVLARLRGFDTTKIVGEVRRL